MPGFDTSGDTGSGRLLFPFFRKATSKRAEPRVSLILPAALRSLADVRNHVFEWESKNITVKLSCGIATAGELEDHETEKDLILKADARLYDAKRSHNLKHMLN